MKKVLLSLFAGVLILASVAAAGFTGYRFGYAQGVQESTDGQASAFRPFDERGPNRMPMHNFGNRLDRPFAREFRRGGFSLHGWGFGFFALLRFLTQLMVLALLIGAVYWLFTRSGWQLTRTQATQTIETQPKPTETETKE